jgi:hypothetical protein
LSVCKFTNSENENIRKRRRRLLTLVTVNILTPNYVVASCVEILVVTKFYVVAIIVDSWTTPRDQNRHGFCSSLFLEIRMRNRQKIFRNPNLNEIKVLPVQQFQIFLIIKFLQQNLMIPRLIWIFQSDWLNRLGKCLAILDNLGWYCDVTNVFIRQRQIQIQFVVTWNNRN